MPFTADVGTRVREESATPHAGRECRREPAWILVQGVQEIAPFAARDVAPQFIEFF
jgi:hypothetical protein